MVIPFSRVYDHSLPHSRLATGDVEGEWHTQIKTPNSKLQSVNHVTTMLDSSTCHINVIDRALIFLFFPSTSHY
ncbi:unnamed protein product [Spirodela intermedia]|uniref:Uncharacterized protein n=1 Tax=Spirodela intermedia TaxID=51605 RepID=A0A7I8L826_SPIIN|nr:unnamed protein product [Spirodela intermedia]